MKNDAFRDLLCDSESVGDEESDGGLPGAPVGIAVEQYLARQLDLLTPMH